MLYGEKFKISQDMVPNVTKQPEVMQAAEDAGRLLGQRLGKGYDRMQVTQKMRQKFMDMLGSSA